MKRILSAALLLAAVAAFSALPAAANHSWNGYQDETGISLNTCMDYYHNTSVSDTKSTHPNAHDYEELGIIYKHLDSFSTVGSAGAGFLPDAVPSFAPATRLNDSTYVDDLGGGRKLVTYVIWVRK